MAGSVAGCDGRWPTEEEDAMPDRSPRTIATINFKGGVGKTTVTWCLGDVLSSLSSERVLMFDLDAQMSLTQAIALNEATGSLHDKFGAWYKTAIERKKTIFDALDAFTRPKAQFDFGVGFDFIYQISEQFHFVPSVEDLYWLELEVFDRDGVKGFHSPPSREDRQLAEAASVRLCSVRLPSVLHAPVVQRPRLL
jgi:cellulose biosynthesis protein BcsQ